MKTMLSAEFQKKVHMIPECQLADYLTPGYEQFLPDDMVTGEASTDGMVQDWITYRKFIEGHDDNEDPEAAIRRSRRLSHHASECFRIDQSSSNFS